MVALNTNPIVLGWVEAWVWAILLDLKKNVVFHFFI